MGLSGSSPFEPIPTRDVLNLRAGGMCASASTPTYVPSHLRDYVAPQDSAGICMVQIPALSSPSNEP